MSKKAISFKSKRGMSLVELLCAIVIMAIVVSCTATGLAVSYRSIILNGEHDKASARAQEYCDVLMTAIQNTPSNEPGTVGADATKNKLFDKDVLDPKHTLKPEVWNYVAAVINRTTPTDNFDQVQDSDVDYRDWKYNDVFFYIKPIGTHTKYIDYEVKVYVTYGGAEDEVTHNTIKTGQITSCKGTVTKLIKEP